MSNRIFNFLFIIILLIFSYSSVLSSKSDQLEVEYPNIESLDKNSSVLKPRKKLPLDIDDQEAYKKQLEDQRKSNKEKMFNQKNLQIQMQNDQNLASFLLHNKVSFILIVMLTLISYF